MRQLVVLFCLSLVAHRLPAQALQDTFSLRDTSDLPGTPNLSNTSSFPDDPGMMRMDDDLQHTVVACTPAGEPIKASSPPTCGPGDDDFYQRFSNSPAISPMTVKQKGYLAVHDIFDPFNLLTIGFVSAYTVGFDSHTAYGPGMRGWARNAGYSFVQDASGEMIGTFAITSITHEDPRYHRDPRAPKMRRFWHAVSHTYVSQHDDGQRMPNYETLLGYPIGAELDNLYVPGIAPDGKSTVTRIGIGLAGNPVDDLITEFLPDVASHIHLRVILVQRILNRVASGPSGLTVQ